MAKMNTNEDYGDFEEDSDNSKTPQNQENQNPDAPTRVKLPGKGEFLGKVIQRLGGNRMDVLCTDGKTRNSRVPGRYRRRMWLRPGNFVIVQPWEFDDNKADIVFQYRGPSINQLQKKGLLDNLKDDF